MNEQTKKALEMAIEAMDWELGGEPLPTLMIEARNACKEALEQDEKFCDGNCVWTDHHPNCNLAKPIQDAIDFLDGSYEAHKIRKALQEAIEQPAMTYEQGFAHGYEAHRVEQKKPHKPEREAWFYEN